MKRLSKQHVLLMHTQMLQASGGSDGIRDDGLLDSALHAPFQTFGGVDLMPCRNSCPFCMASFLVFAAVFLDYSHLISIAKIPRSPYAMGFEGFFKTSI